MHRIGRTGRAGRNGLAISLVNHAEHFNVRKIERFTKQSIPVEVVAGHEPTRRPPSGNGRPGSKPGSRPAWKSGDHRGHGKPAAGGRNDSRSAKPGVGRSDGFARAPFRDGPKTGRPGAGTTGGNRRTYSDR